MARKKKTDQINSRPRSPNAFVASAAKLRIKPNTPPRQRKTESWQREAWIGYEEVGEVQHGVDFLGNGMSKMRMFGAMVPDDPRHPPKPEGNPRADRAIRAFKSESAPYPALIRELGVNLFVTGEVYLVGDTKNDTWSVRSTDELEVTDKNYLIRDYPGGPPAEYTDDNITVIHVMFPHPRWGGLPISPLRGVLASIEEIRRIERVIRNVARSRAAGPGLLLMPEEASFPGMDTSEDEDDPNADPFMNALLEAMMTPIANEDDPSAFVPMLIRAPNDTLPNIRKLSLAMDIDTELVKLERALTRLAQGLPLPPEIVLGKAGVNHWGAFSIDEAVVTAYLEPFAAPIFDALTTTYYRPFLIADGMSEEEANRRMLWYDVTPLITRPNRSADADYGLDHVALSDKAWRRIKGFNEDDAPSDDERLERLLLQRGSFDPTMTAILMEKVGITPPGSVPETEPINQPPTPKPGAAPPDEGNPATPDAKRPTKVTRTPRPNAASVVVAFPSRDSDSSSLGERLSTLDRELRIKAHAAADAAITRSVERANATVISKLGKHNRYSSLLKSTPKAEAAARIGRAALEIEKIYPVDLLSNHFSTFLDNFTRWCEKTYAQAGKLLSIDVPDHAANLTAAREYLNAALIAAASDRLFDPNRQTDPLDPAPPVIAPIIIRQAIHIAGGGQPVPGPLTGIATGPICISASPFTVEMYQWCNNQAMSLEPHNHLAGIRFESWADPVLSNSSIFPAPSHYYPGDHDHCSCDVVPILA